MVLPNETGTESILDGGRCAPDEVYQDIATVRAAVPSIIAQGGGLRVVQPGVPLDKIRQGV